MKTQKTAILFFATLAIFMLLFASPSMAKAWPKKPIQIIVPWPAANDSSTIILSAMSKPMKEKLGVPVKIINHSGGRGVIGAQKLANSRPDGYTFGLLTIGPVVTQPLRGKTPYKTSAFEPIGLAFSGAFTLAARADAPYNNITELAEYARKNNLKPRLGHWGLGAVPTLIAMSVAEKGQFKWQETAYKGLNALILKRNEADVLTIGFNPSREFYEAGDIKYLSVLLPNRHDELPDTATVEEQGFGQAYSIWYGMFAPKGVSKEVVEKFGKTFFDVMAMEEIQKTIKNIGVIPTPKNAEATKIQIENEIEVFGRLMKDAGIIK